MSSLKPLSRAYPLVLILSILVFVLSACGSSGSTSTGSGSSARGTVTIGGKLDTEGQLLTTIYTLLLRHSGFTVNEKLAFGNTPTNFNAIQKGAIDIYPEFTGTALSLLNIKSTFDPQKDYDAIKQQYEQKYKITWLDRASELNDGYALCMTKSQSQSLGITTLSQLAPKVSQFILETPSDGTPFVDELKTTYGFDSTSFKKAQTVDYEVGLTAVQQGQAQVSVCYGTDTGIPASNLVFLQDDKNGFPAFNPAPIVRDSVLQKYPDIATVLNKVEPDLTTQVSLDLQKQVSDDKANMSLSEALKQVATNFLKSKGLL